MLHFSYLGFAIPCGLCGEPHVTSALALLRMQDHSRYLGILGMLLLLQLKDSRQRLSHNNEDHELKAVQKLLIMI